MIRTVPNLIMAATLAAFPLTVAEAEVLATVNGKPITEKILDVKAKTRLYELKREAVDKYLFDHLLTLEQKKTGKSRKHILRSNISKSEVKRFYDNFKKQSAARKRQAPPMEKVVDDIRERLAREGFFSKLKKKYKVAYNFGRPTVIVDVGDLPPKGAKNGPVTIVEFSDFQCPFCKRVKPVLAQVLKTYRGKVKVHFRDYPLPFHKEAKSAAVAARCAADQGKFWEYHDLLFANQSDLTEEAFLKHAGTLKLDGGKFSACLENKDHLAKVDRDAAAGSAAGVSGTPAFFINGVPISGAQPFERFKEIIDEELSQRSGGKKSKKNVMP